MALSFHLGQTDSGSFPLPLDIATGKVGILGRSGSGKTVTARKLAEGFIGNHCQTVIIDPLDVWWGLRSHVDGGPGLNVVIAGGCKADLPLTEHGGEALADLVVERGINLLVVLSELSKNAARRFVAEFCERLYHRKNAQEHRTPTHLIIDEADAFVPQRLVPEATRCFGAVDTIIRRGRSRGLGSTLISQRPATIAKDVLSQIELLVAMQVTAPQDRKALREWVDGNATDDEGKVVLDSLASLPRGTAWVWAPGMDLLERVKISLPHTYDSSYTPKIGEKRPAAPTLKPIDLEQIRAQLADVVKEAEANDPKALRKRIAELEKTKATTLSQGFTKQEMERAVRDALAANDRAWRASVTAWGARLSAQVADLPNPELSAYEAPAHSRPSAPAQALIKRTPPPSTGMSKCENAILTALIQRHPKPSSGAQLAILAGYSPTSGGFFAAMASLRAKGFMEGDGSANRPTPMGIEAAGDVPPIPSGADRLAHWLGQLSTAESRILSVIAEHHPNAVSKEQVCEATGYSATSGGFFAALATLRKLELIERGAMRASDDLMGIT